MSESENLYRLLINRACGWAFRNHVQTYQRDQSYDAGR
jgi:hypothetical protein